MTLTTIIILNGALVLGLLAALAAVMSAAHGAAGSGRTGSHWSEPLELDLVRPASAETELDRAA
ncbi:MAG TPA: hypothetical protein VI142_01275 [Gaiellaceae bacterium]